MTGNALEQSLKAVVDRIYVVNLESRPDRRREMAREFGRAGIAGDSDLVHIFKAVRPPDAGPFSSIGARGCFLSQLGVLREARDKGYRAILLLEDDATFSAAFLQHGAAVLEELAASDWALAYLGHRVAPDRMPGPDSAGSTHWRALDAQTPVVCAHAVLFRQQAIGPMVAYLEQILARPAGHVEGGPMHVDGAYSWFRRAHPEMRTVLTSEQYVMQRASRSDIAQQSWTENLPFRSVLRQLKNRLTRRL